MPYVSSFAVQNWLITPAALAVNQAKPTSISDQVWLLVLSGVGIINLQGNNADDWLRETITIFPDVNSPIQYAITNFGIPVPQSGGETYYPQFSLQQWAPFVGLSSVFEKQSGGVDAGYAVDQWTTTPFITGLKDINNNPLINVFAGIDANVAVRNTSATLYRLSYNFTLLGKIVFSQPTLF